MNQDPSTTPYRGDGPRDLRDDTEPLFELTLDWPPPLLSSACACCDGEATTTLPTLRTRGFGREAVCRALSVPYCPSCVAHFAAGRARRIRHAAIAALFGLLTPWVLTAVWPYAHPALVASSGVAVALAALWGLARWRPSARVSRERGCTAGERPALWVETFDQAGPATVLRGTHPAWLSRLAKDASRATKALGARGRDWILWAGVPVACALAGIPAWESSGNDVYFDNPSSDTLVFEVDRGARTLTLGPGAHDVLHLPSGTRSVVVRRGGQEVERIEGEVVHGHLNVVTPLGLACYGLTNAAYGVVDAARTFGPTNTVYPRERRWHDVGMLSSAPVMFDPLPREVTVISHYGVRGGATKTRFGQLPCDAEAP